MLPKFSADAPQQARNFRQFVRTKYDQNYDENNRELWKADTEHRSLYKWLRVALYQRPIEISDI